jgi:Fe2+ or Zn2+ uptake regulation protein
MHDASAALRDRGLQVTAQRLAVMRAVSTTPHATADQVIEAARADIGTISRQSVYDSLGTLVEAGLVQRIQLLGSPTRFEVRVGDNHHHLVCRGCGRLEDIDCAAGDAPCLTPQEDLGYAIEQAEVTYWGRCRDCLATDARSTT